MYALRLIAGFGSNIDFSVGILRLAICGLFSFQLLSLTLRLKIIASGIILCSWNAHLFPSISLGLFSYWAYDCLRTFDVSECVFVCEYVWVSQAMFSVLGSNSRSERSVPPHDLSSIWALSKAPACPQAFGIRTSFRASFLLVHENESRFGLLAPSSSNVFAYQHLWADGDSTIPHDRHSIAPSIWLISPTDYGHWHYVICTNIVIIYIHVGKRAIGILKIFLIKCVSCTLIRWYARSLSLSNSICFCYIEVMADPVRPARRRFRHAVWRWSSRRENWVVFRVSCE